MSTPTHAYPASSDETFVAQVERAQLCALFDEVGPRAATLCGSWDTHHLAAHLVVREGTPLGIVTLLRPTVGDEEVERLVHERAFAVLVDELRDGPPRMSVFGTAVTDKAGNGMEYFVHHEDVRRARPDFETRELPGWAQDELWGALGFLSRRLFRKAPVGVALKRTDTGELKVAAKNTRTVVVEGLPSELTLFGYGRGSVTAVEMSGEPADVAALQATRLGV